MTDTATIGAMTGGLGALVGSSATVATPWITQKHAGRRKLTRFEIGNASNSMANSSVNAQSSSSIPLGTSIKRLTSYFPCGLS